MAGSGNLQKLEQLKRLIWLIESRQASVSLRATAEDIRCTVTFQDGTAVLGIGDNTITAITAMFRAAVEQESPLA